MRPALQPLVHPDAGRYRELNEIRLFDCAGGDGEHSGCPQGIAKRGNYGSFLQDDWDTIYKMSESRSS